MAAATQVMIEAAAHEELRSFEEHRRWKAVVLTENGAVTVTGTKEAVEIHIAFVKRNQGH